MKVRDRQEEFQAAMKAGRKWTILDCDVTEDENGEWYWEIDKHTFDASKDDGDSDMAEKIAHGSGWEPLMKLWDNLIDKYQPDEYFVDQHNYEKLD